MHEASRNIVSMRDRWGDRSPGGLNGPFYIRTMQNNENVPNKIMVTRYACHLLVR